MIKLFDEVDKKVVNTQLYVSTFEKINTLPRIAKTYVIISNGEIIGFEVEDNK